MTKLVIIRHGHSTANMTRNFAGHTDAELSPIGEEQVIKTAEYVAENYKVDKVYASDLKRAYNTGKAVADRLGLEVIPDENLREIFAGEWEGLAFDYLLETYVEDYGRWKNDIGNARCTGGESVQELAKRILAEVEKIAKENDGKTVAIATHATTIRVTQSIIQTGSLAEMKNIPWVTNASVSELEYSNGKWEFKKVSISDHLSTLPTPLPANV